MNKKTALILLASLCFTAIIGGCGRTSSDNSTSGLKAKKFYWVQSLKGHPVHQMTQIAFTEGCKRLGYKAEIIGTDNDDLSGTIALAEQAVAKGDAAGMAVWTGNPSWNSFIEKASKTGMPVILPHFPVPEGSVPGASGVIATDLVKRAAPDGYTLMVVSNGHALNPAILSTLPYDTAKDFSGITYIADIPNVLVANNSLNIFIF